MKNLNFLKSIAKQYTNSFVFLSYLLVTLAFTYPLISHIGSQIPAGRGDTFQAMSNIDSRVYAIEQLQGSEKITFLFKNLNIFLPYVLLNQVVNKYLAYNLLFLVSFVLSGFGAYLLTQYFTKNKSAAFLAGLIYAFAPFHFYQATAVNIGTMHQEWLPFFILFLFRFFEKFKFKYFIATALFGFLIALTEHQFLAFTALFVALFIGFKVYEDKSLLKNKKLWSYALGSSLLLAIVAFGMFGQLLQVATSDNNFLDPGMNAANKYSIAALDPIAPPAFHAIWPNFNAKLQGLILGDAKKRGSYFIGFLVIIVLGWFACQKYKDKKSKNTIDKNIIFWAVSTLVFYIFSLGPSISIQRHTFYLPYFLVYKLLPFYENIRTTGRMFVFVLLGISLLFAWAILQLQKKYPQRKTMLVAVAGLIILLEFWVAPIKTMVVSHSSFYDQIAKDGGQYKLLEIPGSTDYGFASYALYTDTIHKKQVVNGMPLARKISKQFALQQETPVIKQLLYTIPKGNDPEKKTEVDILPVFDWSKANDVLSYNEVKYITISKVYAKEDVIEMEENFIQKHIAVTNRYEDDYLIAYQVKQTVPNAIFAELSGEQISKDFTDGDGNLYRVIGEGTMLKVFNYSAQPQKIKLSFKAKSSNDPLSYRLISDQQANAWQTSSPKLEDYTFEPTLTSGQNIFKFEIKDAQGKAVNMSNKKNERRGLMITKIEIKE